MDPKRIHEDAEKMEETRPATRGLEDELGGWGEYEEGP